MKFLKLLIVPAVVLLGLVVATPVLAHEATITNLAATCNSDHKVCFDFDVATSGFDQNGRDVIVQLQDAQGNVLESKTEHLAIDTTHVHDCFTATTSTTAQLKIKIKLPEGSDLDLNDSQTSVDTHGCVAPTPTPTATPTSTPTAMPTASATPVAALANTGGLDFRFPLIGLTILVVGLALLVISASRGRSTPTK